MKFENRQVRKWAAIAAVLLFGWMGFRGIVRSAVKSNQEATKSAAPAIGDIVKVDEPVFSETNRDVELTVKNVTTNWNVTCVSVPFDIYDHTGVLVHSSYFTFERIPANTTAKQSNFVLAPAGATIKLHPIHYCGHL